MLFFRDLRTSYCWRLLLQRKCCWLCRLHSSNSQTIAVSASWRMPTGRDSGNQHQLLKRRGRRIPSVSADPMPGLSRTWPLQMSFPIPKGFPQARRHDTIFSAECIGPNHPDHGDRHSTFAKLASQSANGTEVVNHGCKGPRLTLLS